MAKEKVTNIKDAKKDKVFEECKDLADAITLRVLSRRATKEEITLYKEHMEQDNLPQMELAIDIMWTQINSNEFLYNH